MILYNISIIVDDDSHDEMLAWVKQLLHETPHDVHFLKMLDNPHEGTTYCIQVKGEDDRKIIKIQQDITQAVQNYIGTHHHGKAFIFDSKMEYLPFQ